MNARAKKIEHHEWMASKSFRNHVIRQDLNQGLYRSWRCGAPDCGNHHFYVTTTPGRIMVYGDNVTMIWERNEDIIPWARGSINSIEYFSSKVPQEISTHEWDADIAREWLIEQLREKNHEDEPDSERIKLLKELYSELHDEATEHSFGAALYQSGVNDGCDWPDFTNYTSNFLWCREDLKWFLANLPAEVAAT